MTSPSSSAPASAWSVNQVKKLSGSSCCLFLPALFCVWLERLVRSCKNQKMHWWVKKHIRSMPTFELKLENAFMNTHNEWTGNKTVTEHHQTLKMSMIFCFVDKSDHTFPDFHLISVDFEDGSPLSFKWNSLESTLFSKYGFSSKYWLRR